MAIPLRIPAPVSTFLQLLRDYLGARLSGRRTPIADAESLREFIDTRATYVAQFSLYSYLRARAGTRYPELFSDDGFVVSINIAKWHVWLACLSDLSTYAGGLLASRTLAPADRIAAVMAPLVDAILRQAGSPEEAGHQFDEHAERVRARLAACRWSSVPDDGGPFTESPTALVYWAPVVDSLKELDEQIVRNSVRYRWHEVRRELRRDLDAAALLAADDASTPPAD